MRVMMTIFKPWQCFLLQLQIVASALTLQSGPDDSMEATDSGMKKNFLASERHQLGYRGQQLLEEMKSRAERDQKEMKLRFIF